MSGLDPLKTLFVLTAFLFQIVLIAHFALRKWQFEAAIRYGPAVYALSVPAALISLRILLGGKSWAFWIGGCIYLAWAMYGYTVEYIQRLEWRNPMRWSIGGPYVTLYLATVMFYWWPLALLYKPLWYAYAVLFIASTVWNVTSHKKPEILQERGRPA